MAHRIEIGLKRGVPDARGRGVVHHARAFLHVHARSCETRDVYRIDTPLNRRELKAVREAFTDPVTSRSATGRLRPSRFDWLIEVGFKPGVTDNLGHTARALLQDVLGRRLAPGQNVYSSTQYFLRGRDLAREDAWRIAKDLLANALIQDIRVCSEDEWNSAAVDESVPAVGERIETRVRTYDLGGSDDELLRISREGVLSLSLEEMRAIRDYFRRPQVRSRRLAAGLPEHPTDVELECLAQTWSEHCKHKIFAAKIRYLDETTGREQIVDGLFKTYIRASTEAIARKVDWLVSVFVDNAGIVKFTDRYHLAYKVETHNSPSALDPYGGAITGIVGVNRDPMGTGMGCELLANTWGYCLGSPFYDGELPAGLLHPRRIRDGVHHGVIDGGNQSGIPYARGFEIFDDRFIGKPLVYCGTLGRIPPLVGGMPSERKQVLPGDAIVMVGGRIGKDGIHGATFSSEELRHESPAQAVQIGDPITQRMMYEFLLEARDAGLYRAITDNGAGGLSSSIGEMCRLSGGADLDVSLAPLKYEGLQPWEIFLSESQERMSLAVAPETVDALLALARRRDVEATVLGTFTDSGRLQVRFGERVAAIIDLDFLHDGCPRLELEARWSPPRIPAPPRPRAGARTTALLEILGSLNVCSKEHKSRRYDAEVKGLSVMKPFVGVRQDVPGDATVMRVEHGRPEGVVLADGINPFYSDLDTYHMMAAIIDLAVRRAVATGASLYHLAGLDNFCWPDPVQSEKNPDGAYKLAQLVRANQALFEVTTALGVPCISGKDSMKNDSIRGGRKISIPPTVLFSVLGRIADVRNAVSLYFKRPGDAIYAVGVTREELGATEYARLLARRAGTPGQIGGEVPRLEMARAQAAYRGVNQAMDARLLRSAHAPGLGGIAVGLALCALGGDLGAQIDLSALPQAAGLTDDGALFSESCGRFLLSCAPSDTPALEDRLSGADFERIGSVTESRDLVVRRGRRTLIHAPLDRLRKAFKEPLDGV